MRRGKWWNPRLGVVSSSVLLLTMHLALREVLARFDVVSSAFAAGSHVPWWMLACAAAFAAVRLAVFFLVPAAIAWRLTLAFVAHSSVSEQGAR